MLKFLLVPLLVLNLSGAEPVIDVSKIAKKTKAEVEKVLGKPSSEEQSKYGPKLTYQKGKVEVVYIQGKADWITISDLNALSFDEKVLQAVGIPTHKPTFKNENVIRWEPCGELLFVSAFPTTNQKVDYVYVKATTK